MNNEIGAYLSALDRKIFWMDRKTRKDIIMEVRSHLTERVASGESPSNVIASFGPADSVAKDYLRIYGFGWSFTIVISVIALILAIFTVPGIIIIPSDYLGMDWKSLVFLALTIFTILLTAFKGGRKAGIIVGSVACVTRFVVLGILVAAGTVVVQDGAFGAIGFVATSIMLPIIGYLSSFKPSEEEPGI